MTSEHLFEESFKKGIAGEEILDSYFSDVLGYNIVPAQISDERKGIDRFFNKVGSDNIIPVQYKTDSVAGKTGNVFIETVSVGERMLQKGWVYTCEAQLLVYYIPLLKKAYLFNPENLRGALDGWLSRYRVRPAKNKDYWTYGVLVPLSEIEKETLMIYEPVPQANGL